MPRNNRRIDRVAIRMYRLGTGDCFTVKFMKGRTVSFKLMIDCGCWQGDRAHIEPFVTELKRDVKDKVDALVVTHEHKDHVYGFEQMQRLVCDRGSLKPSRSGWRGRKKMAALPSRSGRPITARSGWHWLTRRTS